MDSPQDYIGVAAAIPRLPELPKLKASVASRVHPCQQRKAVYQVPKKHSMTQIVDRNQNMDTMGETPKPNLKIQDLLSQLDFIETASVIHAATEALRHSCGFSRAYADLGLRVPLLAHDEEDCDWVADNIADVRDTNELVSLISAATFRLQELSK
ncbi:MAG: hypothetical protein KME46_33980 [Brasilonema angustatum HA4187-MV1]|nr:hypothetical protein [Brasilonema angustatum HA4187-MV1]